MGKGPQYVPMQLRQIIHGAFKLGLDDSEWFFTSKAEESRLWFM